MSMYSLNSDLNPGLGTMDASADTNTAPGMLGIGGGLLGISICLFSARLWSRRDIRLHWDDWAALSSMVSLLCSIVELRHGRPRSD